MTFHWYIFQGQTEKPDMGSDSDQGHHKAQPGILGKWSPIKNYYSLSSEPLYLRRTLYTSLVHNISNIKVADLLGEMTVIVMEMLLKLLNQVKMREAKPY